MEERRGPAVRMIGCHTCRLTHKAGVLCHIATFFLHYTDCMFLGKENPFLSGAA